MNWLHFIVKNFYYSDEIDNKTVDMFWRNRWIKLFSLLICICFLGYIVTLWLWEASLLRKWTNYFDNSASGIFTFYPSISGTSTIRDSGPVVLAWTKFFGSNLMQDVFMRNFNESQCPYRCVYSDDKELYAKEAAIIVFHIPNLDSTDLPPPNTQRLNAFYVIESPVHSANYRSLPLDFFNVTVTYRKDSDIFMPYDSFHPIVPGETMVSEIWHENEIMEKLKRKTKLALQAVSNCHTSSGRESYVERLKKHMYITEYGKCSGNECEGSDCLNQKIDEHLFYLAFENSICRHYVTEKFWRIKQLIVPVVLSREQLQGLGVPDDSYIAASDFSGPKQLADRLLYLQKHPKEYLRYLSWTKHYTKSGFINPLCQLCQMATEKRKKQIKDIAQWWEGGSECEPDFANKFLLNSAGLLNCPVLLITLSNLFLLLRFASL